MRRGTRRLAMPFPVSERVDDCSAQASCFRDWFAGLPIVGRGADPTRLGRPRMAESVGIAASPGVYATLRSPPMVSDWLSIDFPDRLGRLDPGLAAAHHVALHLQTDDQQRAAVVARRSHGGFCYNAERWAHIYQRPSNASGPDEPLLKLTPTPIVFPSDWSSDGRFLAYYRTDAKTGIDVWVLPLFGDRTPIPFCAASPTRARRSSRPTVSGWRTCRTSPAVRRSTSSRFRRSLANFRFRPTAARSRDGVATGRNSSIWPRTGS